MARYSILLLILLFALPSYSQDKAALAKSDSLFAAGVELYKAGKYKEAIPYFTESDKIDKAILDSTSNRCDYSAMWLASCYYNIGDTIKAEKTHQYYRFAPVDRRLTVVSDSLADIGKQYLDNKRYEDALLCFIQCADIRKSVVGDKHIWYANGINACRVLCSWFNKYEDAIKFGTEYLEIYKSIYGKENFNYIVLLNDLASYNSNLNNYKEAIRLETESIDIQKRVLSKEHSYYVISLNWLAFYIYCIGNYSEAIRLGTKVLCIRERTIGKEHPDYANALNNLAEYNSAIGNYSEAIRLETEALNIQEKVLGKEHPDYATSLNNLATFYFYLGYYSETLHLETEALDIQEKVLGKEHPSYATTLNNLAKFNSATGNYSEAIRLGTEALNIQEKVLGKGHPSYATALNNLATFYESLGNYSEAIRLETEALEIQEKFLGKDHPDYAMSLSNLAVCNYFSGKCVKAIQLGTEALEIQKRVLGTEHPNYIVSLNNLANYNSALGNYQEAIRIGKEVLNIRGTVLGKEHPDYATSLNNLAYYNYDLGKLSEAIRLESEALRILKRAFGKEHPKYAMYLSNLTMFNWKKKDAETIKHCVTNTQLITNIIRKTFADLTNKERNLFWEKYKIWFEQLAHQITLDMPSDSLFANGYNGILMSKGLLLNSEMEVSKLIQESGDKEMEELYNDLRMLRLQIDRQMEKPITERVLNVDSLRDVAQGMERTLVQRSKVYGDYTKNLAIDWKQVQQKLGNKDIAIEFVSFPTTGDSVMYAAYCLRKGMEYPRMYPLFEAKQLKAVVKKAYETNGVSELVWKPMAEEMADVENVYFSPSGELYNIAIESMPDYDNPTRLVSERWNLYRLSSTRELALIKDENSINRSAVYGGLTYNTDATTLINDSRNYTTTRDLDFFTLNVADSLNLRAGVMELPQTRVEAQNIDKALAEIKIDNSLYTDTIGTEASFKALSGQRRNLLHIATHGFYWTDTEVKKMKNLAFLMLNDDKPRYTEDKAMTRSGLLFAGANNALRGGRLPEDVDDGILTAKEISTLDLRGLDLVVLSACQTGLGEITGDGVFGLQRGFKKAGAQTLMMSLWKVDDNATQMLMTQFYKNLLEGADKRNAFSDAQKYLREYDNGRYSAPKYWAAFIMLD